MVAGHFLWHSGTILISHPSWLPILSEPPSLHRNCGGSRQAALEREPVPRGVCQALRADSGPAQEPGLAGLQPQLLGGSRDGDRNETRGAAGEPDALELEAEPTSATRCSSAKLKAGGISSQTVAVPKQYF